jgi:predicted unusual protein kinase regulating ubiquinone biosynthesis (AarF/ABC1/UbiB family)
MSLKACRMADERASVFGEIRRMARTSTAVGGIAARLAGERVFGVKTDRAGHAEDLRTILGGLKGPLMKVAQFLSTVPDALPAEYAEQLAELQANAPAMGWNFVRRRMASELGSDWGSRFATFTQEAVAAASLGQVHRATLPDGADVACKLQYPDMASTVEADLRQLRVAMALYARMDNAIKQDDIYTELCERLREELDYRREAAQMRLYGLMLADTPSVHVPAPIEALSTGRLLTMTWLHGRKLMDRVREDPPQCGGFVSCLVCSVLRLRRDPRRPASGQLSGARRCHFEPARFRGNPCVPRAFCAGGDRAVRSHPRQR